MALRDALDDFLGQAHERRVVLVGIGSSIRRDDAVGLRVLELLEKRKLSNVLLLKTEVVPESYTGAIRNFAPTHVLMIDSAYFGGKPGEGRIISTQSIANATVSTHSLPLTVFADFVRKSMCGNIALLGIQPKDTSLGEGLTSEVESRIKEIAETLYETLR